nr:coiled-coil domain containing 18 [Rousettus aegyptiacus]
MESNSSDCCNKDNEEESLLANVASLRHELKITEWSLQSLGEELSSVSPSENSDYASNPSRSERLIVEDLSQPSQLGSLNYSPFKKVCKMPSSSTAFQKKPRDKVIVFRLLFLKVVLEFALSTVNNFSLSFSLNDLFMFYIIFYYSAQDSLNSNKKVVIFGVLFYF